MRNRSFLLGVIIVPLALWVLLIIVQILTNAHPVGWPSAIVQLALLILGGLLLWRWNALPLTRHDEIAAEYTRRLQALRAATLALTTELDLHDVLQQVVNLSADLAGARYAALGVLDEEGEQMEQFVTTGMTAEMRARIGSHPQGGGVLGMILSERRPLRIDDISGHPRAVGFPPGHPTMTSFLGVPVLTKGRVLGNLYLTDKRPPDGVEDGGQGGGGGSVLPFTAEDQEVVEMFARQAAIAIENALLLRGSRQLAIAHERERFAMDLHDGIIQSIYAIGLALDSGRQHLVDDPVMARDQIDHAIRGLNEVVVDIRNYILNLRAKRFEDQGLEDGLHSILRELRANSFLRIESSIDPGAAQAVSRDQAMELLYIAQEALTNVRKHAQASAVRVTLARVDDGVALSIVDNGRGFDPEQAQSGRGDGLNNIRARGKMLNGALQIHAQPGQGTNVMVTVPILDV
jgi:signal transduction histidine kinase